jgi:glucose/arabinose dehydrogenase
MKLSNWLLLLSPCLHSYPAWAGVPSLDRIHLPPGFKIELLTRVPDARAMTVSPQGTLFVGSRSDKVVAITRKNLKPQKTQTVLRGLDQPLGVAFHDGALYASGRSKIYRIDQVESRLENPQAKVINASLPDESHHGGRFLGFGPDNKLYLGIGAPCNVCDKGPKFANIMRMNPDGSKLEVFAEGIRNTVGFAWHPQTKELWFTDNGRDLMGDDIPGDELNHAPKAGMHFGFPFCHAGTVADPEFGANHPCGAFTKPSQVLGAHVASLGMRFYTGRMFPPEYRNQIFVAEHGSWNRTKKSGYRVMLAKLDGDKVASYTPFAEGFLNGETAWGRPADVLVDLDGALLIADDEAGAIYRVSYDDKASAQIKSAH